MDAINEGAGDDERYKRFSLGRARAFAAAPMTFPGLGFPAATAVGRPGASRTLQVSWMAGREPGTMLENPRQVSAYHYPRRYGPAAPSFSRASGDPDFVAAGLGHGEHRRPRLAARRRRVGAARRDAANLEVLLLRARDAGQVTSVGRSAPESLLKVYLRPGVDAHGVEAMLRRRLGDDVPS